MAIRHKVVIAAAIFGAVPLGPVAQAAEPTLDITFRPAFNRRIGQYVAGTLCHAQVTPNTEAATVVPLGVQLECTINGVGRSVVMPGGYATTGVLVVTSPPIVLCGKASAAVMETQQNVSKIVMISNEVCTTLPSG